METNQTSDDSIKHVFQTIIKVKVKSGSLIEILL